MKLTTAQCKAFSRIASPKNKREALQGVFFDDVSNLCACDGFMFARFYCVSAPGLDHLPRVKKDPLHDRLTGILNAAASGAGAIAASGEKANHHGDKPTLCAKNLRAFARWSVNQYEPDAMPLGDASVSASKLAEMLEVFPDALIYVSSAVDPVYFKSENGDGILLPVRVTPGTTRENVCSAYSEWVNYQEGIFSSAAPAGSLRHYCATVPEIPIKVIGYKKDGNTVVVHRVKGHKITGNVYAYATKPDKYGIFHWNIAAVLPCGYGQDVCTLQDNTNYADRPDATGNNPIIYGKYTVEELANGASAHLRDDNAFRACVDKQIAEGGHIRLADIRLLEEMGGNAERIEKAMQCRADRQRMREEREKQHRDELEENNRREQEQHEQALHDLKASITRDGERVPVDGRLLCELGDSVGVSACIKLKGWIMRKLANVTIENGHMVTYQYNRYKKTETGSKAFWDWMNRLLDALRQQEEEEASEEDLIHLFGRDNAPKLENQAQNLENEHRQPTRNDGADAWRSISSHTVCNLMNEKGIHCDGDYREISNFSLAVLRAGEALPAVDGETWMEFFERAYPVAFPEHNTPDVENEPANLDTATGPEHKNTINNPVAATQELYCQLRPIYGNSLYNVRFEHEDESGYWFSFELVGDTRRQTCCVRRWDLATDTG